MNNNSQPPANYRGKGYLIVKVSTARGAIPLEGASVNIRGAEPSNSDIIYSLISDRDGITKKVELPTPLRGLSEVPGNIAPYALYDIDVFKEGYRDLVLKDVSVFDSITSIQGAVMIPLAANRYPDSFEPVSDISPSDAESIGGN